MDLTTLFEAGTEAFEIVSVAPEGVVVASIDPAAGALNLSFLPEASGVVDVTVAAEDGVGETSLLSIQILVGQRYFVDAGAVGGGDGLSWDSAFKFLHDALAVAQSPDQVWVAAGVYFPDEGGDVTDGDRLASFSPGGGVELYGGFAGDEISVAERSFAAPSVLSGDINQDDLDADGNAIAESADEISGTNSSTVVSLAATRGSLIDGFTLTAGRSISSVRGGGMWLSAGPHSVRNCRFQGNTAANGGGLRVSNGRQMLSDCDFSGNVASSGGALSTNVRTSVMVDRCHFRRNSSSNGGAVENDGARVVMNECVIAENTANSEGGGVYANGLSSVLVRCLLEGNFARSDGGAFYQRRSSGWAILDGCALIGNATERNSYFYSGDECRLLRCTLAGNAGGYRGLVHDENGILSISDSIVWGNRARKGSDAAGAVGVEIGNCLIEGSGGSSGWLLDEGYTDLGGNLDLPPRFVDPIAASLAPSVGGDFRLAAGSAAIDAASGLSDDSTARDLNGLPRSADGDFDGRAAPDMGAFEYSPEFTDSDRDGFLDRLELDLTGDAYAIPPPKLSTGSIAAGGQSYPSLVYEVDARVVGMVEFLVESGEDLRRSAGWSGDALVPVSAVTDGGIHRVEVRSATPWGVLSREFMRLRISGSVGE